MKILRPSHSLVSMFAVTLVTTLLLGSVPVHALAQEVPAPMSTQEETAPAPAMATPAGALASFPSEGPLNGNQPPTTLDPPEGSGFGRGVVTADPATGTAHASIGFRLPKARGNAQPQLGLSYSSDGNVGEAGYGWTLGLPRIERRNPANGPRYADPLPGEPIDPNAADEFDFSGVHIVPICLVRNGQCTNNAVLQPGETFPAWANGWMYYRPRVETSFARLFWSDTHRTWIFQGQGITMEFGVPLDSPSDELAVDRDPAADADNPPIFRWNLVRMRDAHGAANQIRYLWQRFPAPDESTSTDGLGYLTDVYDTSKQAEGGSATFAHHTRLAYVRDPSRGTFSEVAVWRRRPVWRLDHLDVTSAEFSGSGPRRLVRRYSLSYLWRAHMFQARSMLMSVDVSPSCAIEEDQAFRIPDDIGVCGGDKRPVAQMTYAGQGQMEPGIIGPLRVEREIEDEISFLDVDHNGSADLIRRRPNGEMSVRILDKPGSAVPMTIKSNAIEPGPDLLFKNNKLGDWLRIGQVDALQLVIDSYKEDPKWAAFLVLHQNNSWNWRGGTLSARGIPGWWDGVTQRPDGKYQATYLPLSQFHDLDADGYLDRFVLVPDVIILDTGGGGHGVPVLLGYKEQHAFLTTLVREGVEPFARATPRKPFQEPPGLNREQGYDIDASLMFDLTNDRVPDLVLHYSSGEVGSGGWHLWRGLGNGYVEKDSIPLQDSAINPKEYRQDVNGDQVDDVIEVHDTGLPSERRLSVYFGGGAVHHQSFPLEDETYLQFADLDGSGVNSIIMLSKKSKNTYFVRYNHWRNDTRPGLLLSLSNGFGATTKLSYRSTSVPGTFMPLAHHYVTRIETSSNADASSTGGPYITEYDYTDPVYENLERRFRGFRVLKTIQHGTAGDEVTKTAFLMGDCNELHPGECFPGASYFRDNPTEALSRQPVLVERFDGTGRALSTTHAQYRLRTLYKGMDGRSVRTAYVERSDTWLYDTAAPGAPEHVTLREVVAESPDHEPPKRVVTLAGGHTTRMAHLVQEMERDGFGHVTKHTDFGTVDGGPDVSTDSAIVRSTVWALPSGDASRWNWRATDGYAGDVADQRHTHVDYDQYGSTIRVSADLKGTLQLVRFHEDPSAELASDPLDASRDRVGVVLSELEYDAYGNPVRVKGANNRCASTAYDEAFHQMAVAQTVHTNGCGSTGLTTITSFDRGLEVPTMTIAPTGAVSTLSYDGYGRPIRVFQPNAATSILPEAEPSVRMTYFDAVGGPYRRIQVEMRDDAGGAARYRSAWSYVDPYGLTVATVGEADTSAGDPAPHVVSGQALRDARGLVTARLEPRFDTVDPASPLPPTVKPDTPRTRATYDTFGRLEQSFGLDGAATSKSVYHALSVDTFDASDLAAGATPHPATSVHDGHGRTTRLQRATSSSGMADTLVTQMIYSSTGDLTSVIRSHAASGEVYARHMTYDSFGRLVQNDEPNTSKDFADPTKVKSWRYAYNDAGDVVGTSDARGCGQNAQFDGIGRLLAKIYSPCSKTHGKYANRPAARWIYDAPEDGQASDTASYAGKLAAVYDRAQHVQYFYDGRGRATRTRKQIAVPNDELDPVVAYAGPWFEKGFGFDDADRVIAETTGASIDALLGKPVTVGSLTGRSVVTTSYSARGLPVRVGGSYGELVTSTVADADGRIRSRAFGDVAGTIATYDYDDKRLLAQARIARSSKLPTVLQDLQIDRYDPVNNPLRVGDGRLADEWPDGAKPVSRVLQYDDLYQLRRVDYAFPTTSGTDKQVSVFAAEAKAGNRTPVPEQTIPDRVKWQVFDYDWQGNLRTSDDDAHAFFDRSMGSASYGSATQGPNRIVSASLGEGRADTIHDAAGNLSRMLVRKKDAHGDYISLLFAYDWDEVGRLVRARRLSKAEIPRIDVLGTQVLQMDLSRIDQAGADLGYVYDAGGQRVIKIHKNRSTQARRYSIEVFGSLRLNRAVYDGEEYGRTDETEVPYLVSNGVALGRVIYNVDLPKGADGKMQHVFFTLTDPLGSTSVVIDKATGELVERATYLAYGQAESDHRPERWESFREDYRFTGKEDDVGVGLAYFGARFYVAALGQWASADPLTVHDLGSDLNPYAFVAGSPLRYVDPNGLDYCEVCWIAGSGWNGGLWGWDPFGSPLGDAMKAFWNRVGSAGGPKFIELGPRIPQIEWNGGYWDYSQKKSVEPPPPEHPFAADTVVVTVSAIWITLKESIGCGEFTRCGHLRRFQPKMYEKAEMLLAAGLAALEAFSRAPTVLPPGSGGLVPAGAPGVVPGAVPGAAPGVIPLVPPADFAAKGASTPTGAKGQNMNVPAPAGQKAANSPTTIGGREFSAHALDRMQGQGITPSAVESAISYGGSPGKMPGTTASYDPVNNISVITNTASGRVVTVDYGLIRQ
ncbi:toxin TcdB middle/N-terminal domain-containing protein [Pendulispora albinea]|uniref:Insecticide toxin TcdB middle/N-terminal domain-containing protein n=1 Tax=Pendulispora albinea TaxID=2741071 RepID=A0ABZ2M7X4_9BACT